MRLGDGTSVFCGTSFLPTCLYTVIGARLVSPAELMVNWTIAISHAGASEPHERFEHSTLHGMLLTPERLQTTRPDYVPHLTARGKARLSVLELCDGRRALDTIEREIYRRHADLFRDPDEAAVFVAEVVSTYSE